MDGTPTARFAQLVNGPESELREHLDEAALLIAAHARPGLDIDHYRGRLDELAARCEEPVLAEVSHQLFGVEGLRVADSSIFPHVTYGNLNGPSIMTGEKAADHILGKQPLPRSNQEPWVNPRAAVSDR